MNLEDWQTRVDSIDLGDMRLYHAYAFNEKTKQVIEGDTEHPDEELVRHALPAAAHGHADSDGHGRADARCAGTSRSDRRVEPPIGFFWNPAFFVEPTTEARRALFRFGRFSACARIVDTSWGRMPESGKHYRGRSAA